MPQRTISQTLFYISVSSFVVFIGFWEFLQYFLNNVHSDTEKILPCYDYIIVGSGTAGSTVALRLSEDVRTTVLLLEAGVFANFLFSIPALGPLLQVSNLDWQYRTEPQKHACKALKNKVSHWPAGRSYGGSGRLNNMVYLRGHREDYNIWYKDKPDYDYTNDVYAYYKKMENHVGKNKEDLFHYTGGPFIVDDMPYVTPLADAFLDAVKILGYPERDMNGMQYTGFMKPHVNLKNGRRWLIADELLEYKHLRPNLHILTGVQVTKILFKNCHEAYGVSYKKSGNIETTIAKKGIILSAGVIGTPKLLLLSGIGPKDHLNELGIDVKADLPVGENLQDHITTGLDLVILNQTLPLNPYTLLLPSSAYKYFAQGEGPWTTVGCEVIGVPETNYDINKSPKLQLMVLPVGATSDGGIHLKKALNINDTVWDSYFQPLIGKQVISILPVLLHPKSKGTVRLKSSDPYAMPIIDPKYLSNKEDVDILIKGIRTVVELIKTEPMQALGAQLYTKKFPGCEKFVFNTKNYWECYVRHFTLTSYHPGGTCKMGKPSDRSSVVDFNYKVKGFEKLYVADASVMPILTSANINAAVVLLAERFADILIKKSQEKQPQTNYMDLFITKSTCDVS